MDRHGIINGQIRKNYGTFSSFQHISDTLLEVIKKYARFAVTANSITAEMKRYETWVFTKNKKWLNIEHNGWNEHEIQFFYYYRIKVKSLHSVASQSHFKEFDELAKDLSLLLSIIIQMLLFTVYIDILFGSSCFNLFCIHSLNCRSVLYGSKTLNFHMPLLRKNQIYTVNSNWLSMSIGYAWLCAHSVIVWLNLTGAVWLLFVDCKRYSPFTSDDHEQTKCNATKL